jgi:hypothetical protein
MAADQETDNRLRKLEREVKDLTGRLDELVRMLKKVESDAIKRAARRGEG